MKSSTIGSRAPRDHVPSRRWDDAGVNVGEIERWISAIAGVGLLAVGLRKRRLRRVLWPLGSSLIGRAVTGRSTLNYVLGCNTARERRTSPVASLAAGTGKRIERSVIVARSPEELFHFWRDFTNLPRFMDNLESVQVLDEDRSHWVARGPAGTRVEWDAAIHNEIEGELIAWRSLPGADVDQAGSVHFVPAGDGLTEVRVVMRYRPKAGKVGDLVAKLLGDDPDRQVGDDLRRFKQVVEAAND
ncbi:MAG TPA: SRPBCC family protein [Gemmatimonadales bacterium]